MGFNVRKSKKPHVFSEKWEGKSLAEGEQEGKLRKMRFGDDSALGESVGEADQHTRKGLSDSIEPGWCYLQGTCKWRSREVCALINQGCGFAR